MRKTYSKSGAALLIVLLFIALISAMAFTIGRQMLSEFILSINAGNSTGAYYAAEAGIEDGLLRYKLDHNYQIIPQTITLDNKTKYELTVGYKTQIVGALGSISGLLTKDMPLDLDVSWNGTTAVDNEDGVKIIAFTFNKAVYNNNGRIEGDKLIGVELTEFQGNQVWKKSYNDCNVYPDLDTCGQIKVDRTGLSKVRLKAFIKSDQKDAYVNYLVNNDGDNRNALIDSGITTITSVGFVGKNVRKLELKIDRATGATIGFLDYALYAGGGDIK